MCCWVRATKAHQFCSGLNVTEEKGGWPKLKYA